MPRKARLFVPGAIYHVYCRVARGEFVFDDPYEAAEFVQVVRLVSDLDGWSVLAWCLMGNHYHLVTQTASVPLWRSMARLQRRVARGYNRRHRLYGRLWQSRYKARVIDSQEYFRQVVAYVHLNPVCAGVVSDPAAYPHSGHAAILGRCRAVLVDVQRVLRGFGDGSITSARDEYLAWVRTVAEAKWSGLEELPWWAGASHGDEIASAQKHSRATTFDGGPTEEGPPLLELDDVLRRFEQVSGCRLEELASRGRSPRVARARADLASIAVGAYGHRVRDVAKALNKNAGSVSRWLTQVAGEARDDPKICRELAALTKAIATLDPTM